jgi:hypothetical protein
MAKIKSLSVLVDGSSPEAKEFLAEKYAGVIANVQKMTTSGRIKNTDLSGDPEAGTLVAKRFVNATSQDYGTARAAGKGNAVKDKEVTIPIDKDKEFVEEIEEKDVKLLGVEGLIDKRSRNHTLRMAAELDEQFYAQAKAEGTAFTPAAGVTEIQEIVESAIVTLETLKNNYIDGLDRSMLSVVMSAETYSAMRMYLDKVVNTNVDTTSEEFFVYHGVKVFSSTRLPAGVKFMVMMDGSVAQPVMSHPYKAEKIPLSDAVALELFFYYGTKAVTPETILYYTGE